MSEKRVTKRENFEAIKAILAERGEDALVAVMEHEIELVSKKRNAPTKAQKANPMLGLQGGLVKVEAALDNSNVMIVCPACEKVTKVKHEMKDGKKVRVCKKCGEQLDV